MNPVARIVQYIGRGCVLAVLGGLWSVSAAGAVPPAPAIASDALGDVVTDDGPVAIPQADAVGVVVEARAGEVAFTLQVKEPVDPTTSVNWTKGDTYIYWEVDTTGDGVTDFTLDYIVEENRLAAAAVRRGRPGSPRGTCPARAGYAAASGYTVFADNACLGNPSALSYAVELSWDTGPGNEESVTAVDALPDDGKVGPVSLAPSVPIQGNGTNSVTTGPPSAAPPATQPPTPAHPTPTDAPVPGSNGAPGSTAPGSAAPTSRLTSPGPGARSQPSTRAVTGQAAESVPANGPEASPRADGLARTGSGPARPLAAGGGGLLALGGLAVLAGASRRATATPT